MKDENFDSADDFTIVNGASEVFHFFGAMFTVSFGLQLLHVRLQTTYARHF